MSKMAQPSIPFHPLEQPDGYLTIGMSILVNDAAVGLVYAFLLAVYLELSSKIDNC